MDWYPFYPALYKAKTMHLNPFQDGCYRRLIDHYMETRQPLPDNDAALARIVGISLDEWLADARAMLRPFFKARSGSLFQSRCDKVLAEQDGRNRKMSEKGKKGAEKRWNKINQVDARAIAQPMPDDATRQDKTRKEEEKGEIFKVSALEASIMFEEFWTAYPKKTGKGSALVEYRRAMDKVSHADLMKALKSYKFHKDWEFKPSPEKWLFRQSWQDVQQPSSDTAKDEEWLNKLNFWKQSGEWESMWGPPPNDPRCICPSDVLNKFNRK